MTVFAILSWILTMYVYTKAVVFLRSLFNILGIFRGAGELFGDALYSAYGGITDMFFWYRRVRSFFGTLFKFIVNYRGL
jgi:hypothetical protein